MADLLTTVSILLAVASTTLAIAAFVFSWVSFRNTSQMQMNAQAILAQISQRVEVVVERTSQQMDRAWEYFTSLPAAPPSLPSEALAEREEKLRAQVIEEARQEAAKAIKSAGLDKEALKNLLEQVQGVIDRSAERTRHLLAQQDLLGKVSEIEGELRLLAAEPGIGSDPEAPLERLAEELRPFLVPGAVKDLDGLINLRSRAMSGDFDWSKEEIDAHYEMVHRLLRYFRRRRREEATLT